MSNFEAWEQELEPEISGFGKPMHDLTYAELEARINAVEAHMLDLELDEVSTGRMTPDELAEEARKSNEFFGDNE
jgi:hypothetical protein